MDGNEKAAEPIDFNRARVASTYKDLSRQIVDTNDVVTRAIRRLQTTLDIASIADIFYDELSNLMDVGQLRYQAPNENTYCLGENPGAHNCQFNLIIENTRLGKLSVCRKKRYSDDEISIIEFMASTVVFPLKNALMYQEAINAALSDQLTGLGNKRALDSSLHREAERAIRKQQELSAIMIDIDRFKLINDTYGHSAGDEILQQFATLITENFRKTDLSFRYGGEEFLLLLDDSSANSAALTAERLRQIIEAHNFSVANKTIKLTASFGCTSFDHKETLKSFVTRADKALYTAKKMGRNTVQINELTTQQDLYKQSAKEA
ncbi:hypothetical protein A3715_08865 [Oleiphilus sp. HI0009]|nr:MULTISPECIES: GGDEF domain-containing protein [unclassified Oleiphilus]KZX79243.1 hypothetical protein A3715_08865 [Oleiphilus sp. HI0009]KZY64605.1 hypothetical protein A3738_09940 [Oleiphilus sp. HI0066]KZY68684.1 hypothetical protein A3739_10695 [Oleiphilus sp. HI0067]